MTVLAVILGAALGAVLGQTVANGFIGLFTKGRWVWPWEWWPHG